MHPAPLRPSARRGMALVMAVLVLLAMSAVAAAMLFIAGAQARAAAFVESGMRARLEAEAAAREAFAAWSTGDAAGRAVGERWVVFHRIGPAPGQRRTVVAEHLASGLALIRGRVAVPAPEGATARAATALLVRFIPPEELLASFPAAAVSNAPVYVEPAGVVDGLRSDAAPDGWPAGACPSEAVAALDSVFAVRARPALIVGDAQDAAGADPTSLYGLPGVAVEPGREGPPDAGLGPVPWNMVPRLADGHAVGAPIPGPLAGPDGCRTASPDNWGDPGGSGPCAEHLPLIHAAGHLVMDGGTGQGILVVDGNLELRAGARFYGPVLVRGRAIIHDGALVHGTLVAGGGLTVEDGTVLYGVCPLWRAFTGARALDGAFRPVGRWWIPDHIAGP